MITSRNQTLLLVLSCYIVLLLALPANKVGAQNPFHRAFHTTDGLPSEEVYGVEFDSEGRGWFCSDRGLSRYDGYEFKVYTSQDGLPDNTVLKIRKDPGGRLWFLTLDGRLSYWSGDSIVPFPANSQLPPSDTGFWEISDLVWDGQGRMLFWYHTRGRFDRLVYHRWEEGTSDLESLDFEDLAAEYPQIDLPDFPCIDLGADHIPSLDVKDLYLDGEGRYCYRHLLKNALWKGDLSGGPGPERIPVPERIHTMRVEGGEVLWAATAGGVLKFDSLWQKGDYTTYFPGLNSRNMGRDREGNLWLSTLEQGILQIPSLDFKSLDFQQLPNPQPSILTMFPLENHLLLTTVEGRILALDSNLVPEVVVEAKEYFNTHVVLSPHPEGALGFNGLVKETPDGLEWEPSGLVQRFQDLVFLGHNRLLAVDRNKFSVAEQTPAGMVLRSEFKGNQGRILALLKREHSVWGGATKGIFRVPLPESGLPGRMEWMDGGPHLNGQRVNDLKANEGGWVFAATIGNGLVLIRDQQTYQFDRKDGLSGNMINQLALENDSTLWLGTTNGLDRVRLRLGSKPEIVGISHIGPQQGLASNYIREVEWWRGRLWISTEGGLACVDPEQLLKRRPVVPRVAITGIEVNRAAISLSAPARWEFDQNDLAIDFHATSYAKPPGVPFYRYRLLPSDSAWSYSDSRRVQFLGLPPGRYTFEVAARNHLNQWSAPSARYAFEIRSHFTQTGWFWLGIVGIALLLLVMGAALWARQRRKKEGQRMLLQEARLTAKEAELVALRNQMNPHFVFNALNSIQAFIFKQDAPQASFYLGKFAQLMRSGLEFSTHKFIPLADELAFLKAYLELESLRFPGAFRVDWHIENHLQPEVIFIPPFLFQPILENAVKHGFRGIDYPGRIEVRIAEPTPDCLEAIIQDNGVGLEGEKARRNLYTSRGLEIVRHQVQVIDQTLGTASFTLAPRTDGSGVRAIFQFHLPALCHVPSADH